MDHSNNVNKGRLLLVFIGFYLIASIGVLFKYTSEVEYSIRAKYNQISSSLVESVNLLESLRYNFNLVYDNPDFAATANLPSFQMKDGLCSYVPDKLADHQDTSRYYILLGEDKACQEGSPENKIMKAKTIIAPIFAFMSQVNQYVYGLYFFSVHDYMLAAPLERVDNFNHIRYQAWRNVWRKRSYWLSAKNGDQRIKLSGPYTDEISGNSTLSITEGMFDHDVFQGVVVKDILTNELINQGSLRTVHILSLKESEIPDDAYLVKQLQVKGLDSNHILYVDFNLFDEVKYFFEDNSVLLGVLFISLAGLFFIIVIWDMRRNQEQLRILTKQDPLTGLLNRRGLEVAYKKDASADYKVLAIFDIDDFKKINDKFGHDVGDNAIIFMAETLKSSVRNTDCVARFGGEEFIVYANTANLHVFYNVLDKIREKIEEKSTRIVSDGFTVSAGVEAITSTDTMQLNDLIKKADIKLYHAKQTGKNKVVY